MEFMIGLLRVSVVAGLLYGGYWVYPYVETELKNSQEPYEIEVEPVEKIVEAPASLAGYSFQADGEGTLYFTSASTCELRDVANGIGMEVKGTPTVQYKKTGQERAILKLRYTVSKNEGRELLEYEHSYEYELRFEKNHSGRANLNYVIIHRIGAGDSMRTFTEADNRPIRFSLRKD